MKGKEREDKIDVTSTKESQGEGLEGRARRGSLSQRHMKGGTK